MHSEARTVADTRFVESAKRKDEAIDLPSGFFSRWEYSFLLVCFPRCCGCLVHPGRPIHSRDVPRWFEILEETPWQLRGFLSLGPAELPRRTRCFFSASGTLSDWRELSRSRSWTRGRKKSAPASVCVTRQPLRGTADRTWQNLETSERVPERIQAIEPPLYDGYSSGQPRSSPTSS